MRIAFLTYEYPPDIAKGGIGTYVNQIAHVLAKRNHDVNVFCARPYRDLLSTETNVKVHRIKCVNPSDFNSQLLDLFTKIHELEPFDIIESPEIFGHAYLIKNKYPRIPLVVKFHMPIFLQMRLYFTFDFFRGDFDKGMEVIAQQSYKNSIPICSSAVFVTNTDY